LLFGKLNLDTCPVRIGVEGIEKHQRNRKYVKHKVEETNLVMGEGINLQEIKDLEDATLVGHFTSKRMSMEILKK
jgi:hypothetical protein